MPTKQLGKVHPGSWKVHHRNLSPSDKKRKAARALARRPLVLQMPANRSGVTAEMLEGKTVHELRTLCHDLGIKAGVRVRKQGLIDLLVAPK